MTPWIVVAVYFVLGGIATAIINKRKPEGAKERWVKYIVYFFVVSGMMTIISLDQLFWAALVLFAVGMYEVIRVGSGITRMVGLFVFFATGIMFVIFSGVKIWPTQLAIYITVLTFDGFAQIAGQLFGKNKLASKISPGKTIEGLIGGFVMAVVTAILIGPFSITANIGLAISVCMAALAGDLLASYYKRKCGVKDYSHLIPGHGGVLDRFDSFIFAGASIWLLT